MLALADRILRHYTRVLDVLGGICLAVMVLLVFGNVVLRYTFNSGITVSEELSRWLFVWLTFTGAVVALREHGHLGTDVLVSRLRAGGKKVCLLLAQLCTGLTTIFFQWPLAVAVLHTGGAAAITLVMVLIRVRLGTAGGAPVTSAG